MWNNFRSSKTETTFNHFFYRSATKRIETSKELQIVSPFHSRLRLLSILYNDMNQIGLMNLLVLGIIVTHVICLYGVIAMKDTANSATLLMFLVSCLDCLLAVFFIFGQAARVHSC